MVEQSLSSVVQPSMPTLRNVLVRLNDTSWRHYLLSVLAAAIATFVRMLLDPLFGEKFPYITYLLATFVIAWCGGLGPSLLALTLGFLSAFYFFASPRQSFLVNGLDAQVGAFSYIVTGICSIILFESLRVAERRALRIAQELTRHQQALESEIQQRKLAQESVVSLLRKLVDVQEEERRRISRELHDQCGQDLTALRLELKLLEGNLDVDSSVMGGIRTLNQMVDRIADEVHHLALKLRPPALDDLGLPSAIADYVDAWSKRTLVRADFEPREVEGIVIPSEVETALYRILQEALTNVAKHAEASNVNVVLLGHESGVDLIVEDDGCGFIASELFDDRRAVQQLGLMSMRERMLAVGGNLEIESAPGRGTTIFARVKW